MLSLRYSLKNKMGDIQVKDKDVVVPGEVLAEGMDYLPAMGTFRDNEKIIASQVGVVNISGRLIKIIPLTGRYLPRKDDVIIGKITDIGLNGWRVDIRFAYEANLNLKDGSSDFIERKADLTQYYNYGEIIMAAVLYSNGSKIIDLGMKGPGLRKLTGGRIIEINSTRIPRLIGKQGSMITMIKEKTECKIFAGQNGRVWVSGADPKKELIAINAIKQIDEGCIVDGLTDKIKAYLEGALK